MIHLMIKRFCLLFFTFFMVIQGAVPVRAETVTIVADNWCPYNCEPKSDKPGFMIEIAQKVFEKHGITVDYKILPWTRAVEETRAGKYTAVVGALRKDVPDFIFPEEHQARSQDGFFVKKGNPWRFKDISSLESVSLGAIAGYAYNDEINDYVEAHKDDFKRVQLAFGGEALYINAKKLLLGRIGALVENVDVMRQYLKDNKKDGEIEFAGSLSTDVSGNLYVAFSPANPDAARYATMLSEGTKVLRESGELKAIMVRYGLEEFSQDK